MPDPRKLECLKGQYIYNIRNEKISLMKETGKKSQLEKYIYMTFNDLLICKQTILKKFKLEGSANLWSDDVKYSFLKNKLYRIEVQYNPLKFKKNNNEIKNSLNNLLKRYQGKDNVEEFGPSNSRMTQGKDYDWMSSIYLFNPRSNRNIDVIIFANYRQKKYLESAHQKHLIVLPSYCWTKK